MRLEKAWPETTRAAADRPAEQRGFPEKDGLRTAPVTGAATMKDRRAPWSEGIARRAKSRRRDIFGAKGLQKSLARLSLRCWGSCPASESLRLGDRHAAFAVGPERMVLGWKRNLLKRADDEGF